MIPKLLRLAACLPLVAITAADNSGDCFSSSSGLGAASYSNCCSGRAGGQGEIDGTEFEYHCKAWFTPVPSTSRAAASARSCAQLCRNDEDCVASTWDRTQNKCFLSEAHDDLGIQPSEQYGEGFIAFHKRAGTTPPVDACQSLVNEAVANEAAACEAQMKPIRERRDELQKERDELYESNQRLGENARASEKVLEEYKRCPLLHLQQTTVGTVTYKQYCSQGVSDITAPSGPREQLGLSYDECLVSCSNDSWCQGGVLHQEQEQRETYCLVLFHFGKDNFKAILQTIR
ncbi:hypothetical protein BDV25DRAFT_136243 [Aspergillus avenaceus]|uniref:Apple domain-containing protein n=1 Tax=Aspergillus avenaceus TaxID=36643 RepID=A0A5N6U629_ASPAV|nr:hypothetical protein BDV25DRAFT_136243 [Aspergillus avenaceus]